MNIDGYLCIEPNRNGIDPILRNHEGNDLLTFSKHINVEPTIHVELLVVREDLLIVAASCWTTSYNFVLESNSQTFIAWFTDLLGTRWMFQNMIRECLFSFDTTFCGPSLTLENREIRLRTSLQK